MTDAFAPRTEPRRDRWGRPLILQGNGTTLGYTRATTVAKTLDDEGALAAWKMRMVALGMARRPDLVALASTYTAKTDKRSWEKITQAAMDAAASDARANIGTALHGLVEQINRGGTLGPVLPELEGDVAAYRAMHAQLEISEPEAFVVHDDWRIAGTHDFVLRHPHTGRMVIGDLKTGADLQYSWRSIAVQLAIYSNAQWRYDAATDTRYPMPELDRSTGLVLHLPAGEGRCTLWEVDLVAGLEALERSRWTREWRKTTPAREIELNPLEPEEQPARKPRKRKLAETSGDSSPAPAEAQPEPTETPKRDPASEIVARFPGATTAPDPAPPVPREPAQPGDRMSDPRRWQWLRDRVAVLRGYDGALQMLADRWPAHLPPLKTHRHTDADIDEADALIGAVESRHRVPFGAPDPGEGPDVDPELVSALMNRCEALPAERFRAIKATVAEARDSGRPLNLKPASQRRFAVVEALYRLAADLDYDEGLLAACLGWITGRPVSPPYGAVCGRLTLDGAAMLADAIDRLSRNVAGLVFDDEGRPTITPLPK